MEFSRNGKIRYGDGPTVEVEYAHGDRLWVRDGKLLRMELKRNGKLPRNDGPRLSR